MERINKIEKEFSFQFCADYRQYLEDGPPSRTSAFELSQRTGTLLTNATSFFEQVGSIYGRDHFANLVEEAEDGGLRFWHVNLLKHAYPVGKSMMGDPIVQVTNGKYKGQIFMTNHEGWYGGFEHFALRNEEDFEELEEMLEDFIDIEEVQLRELSTDQFIEILNIDDLDGNIFLAGGFDDFYETTRQTQK